MEQETTIRPAGQIRRIDDLGRVVIPKEIRSALELQEGSPLEIFMTDDAVVLKKYDEIQSLKQRVNTLYNHVLNDPNIKTNRADILRQIKDLRDMLPTPEQEIVHDDH